MKYISLAPRNEKRKEYEEYYNALDFALQDKTIQNIAVTGSFGTGKSTVLNSYFDNHKELKVIKVSLAKFGFSDKFNKRIDSINFDCDSNGNNDDTKNDVNDKSYGKKDIIKNKNIISDEENRIQLEVLKRIFYAIDGKRLSGNQFCSIKRQKTTVDKIIVFIKILTYLLLPIYLLNIKSLVSKVIEVFSRGSISLIKLISYPYFNIALAGIIFLILFAFFISNDLDRILTYVKTISFNGVKADIRNENIIDKYLHEILNLAINVDENIFIFEDLDRCENKVIFNKFRDLCITLNNNELVKMKFNNSYNVKCIKFIYAVKDDLVYYNQIDETKNITLCEEKTKFFDFVIPIIPIATQNNVHNIFIDYKNKLELKNIDDNYIFVVCSYINDLRLINNVFNEFQIYKQSLLNNYNSFNNEFDDRQLLTLIIFKNLYPKQFVEFQFNGEIGKVVSDIKKEKDFLLEQAEKDKDEFEHNDEYFKSNPQHKSKYSNSLKLIESIRTGDVAIYNNDMIVEKFAKLDDNQFLRMGIIHGFINESVNQYINYFYDNYIDENDNEFIKLVYAGKNDIGYKIHYPDRVFDRLTDVHFKHFSAVNYDIIEYAINDKFNDIKTNNLLNAVMNQAETFISVLKYFKNNTNKVLFKIITMCYKHNNEYCIEIILNNEIYDDDKLSIINCILMFIDEDSVFEIDRDGIISEFASENIDKIIKFDDKLQKLYIDRLHIDCKNLSYEKYKNNIWIIGGFIDYLIKDKIDNNEFFAYYDNLKLYFIYKKLYSSDFENDNFKFINEFADDNFKKSIKMYLDEYIKECLLKTNLNSISISDSFVGLLYYAKDDSIVKDIVLKLQGKQNLSSFIYDKIDDEDLDDEYCENRLDLIYNSIINNDSIQLSMNDMFIYYIKIGWTEQLTCYFEKHFDMLLNNNNIDAEDEEKLSIFYSKMIINCCNLQGINRLLKKNKIDISDSKIVNLPKGLLLDILKNNNLLYNSTKLPLIRNITTEGLSYYIYHNSNSIIESNHINLLNEIDIQNIINNILCNDKNDNKYISEVFNKFFINHQLDVKNTITKEYIISSNFNYDHRVLNRVLLNLTNFEKLNIIYDKIEIMSVQQLKALVVSNNSPFINFINIQTMNGGSIDKKIVGRKDFIMFNKVIKKLSKKDVLRIIKSGDKDILAFETV